MHKLLLLTFGLLGLSVYQGQAQTRLTDFSNRTGDKSSSPSGFVSFHDLLFFEATTEAGGREIWVSGGSEDNTRLLKDIYPGKGNGIQASVFKQSAVTLGDQLFFIANDGENGSQIWATQGTGQSTRRITNLAGFNAVRLTRVGEHIFFLLKNNDQLQVWKSDGTAPGTVLVEDNLPAWNQPTFEGAANNLFFFTFQPYGKNDSRVWRSDGTKAGTFPITEELDGNGAGPGGTSALTQYIEFNNELYFVVRSSARFSYPNTVGIVKTNGRDIIPVKGVHPGSSRLVSFADVIRVKNKLYFSFFEVNLNRLVIWESDGTEAGTKMIYDETNSRYFIPSNLYTDGEHLIFTGNNAAGGTSLLKLAPGTYQVEEIKELDPNPEKPFIFLSYDAFLIQKLAPNSVLIFHPKGLDKIWLSGLSAASTTPVTHLKVVKEVAQLREEIIFPNVTDAGGVELWKADQALSNSRQVLNINQSGHGLTAPTPVVVQNKVFFTADDGEHGKEVWVYNHASKEKKLVKDIAAGKNTSFPSNLTFFKDRLFFTAYAATPGAGLWQTDGSETGTVSVGGLEGIPATIDWLTPGLGQLFFVARLNNRYLLCATDGLTCRKIADLGVNTYGVPTWVIQMTVAGNYLYFITQGEGNDLWRSDGTEAGTLKVMDLAFTSQLTAVNDKVYFTTSGPTNGEYELWQSDGSPAGTGMVKNIGEGYSSNPDQLFGYKDQLIFTAYTQESGREYWKSDGTAAGTVPLAEINPGMAGSAVTTAAYAVSGGLLYFSAFESTHGTELWKTDGTPTGTTLVKDIHPGPTGSFPQNLTSHGEKVYFSAYTPEGGTELWVTEGTASTTRQLLDLTTGPQGSNPGDFRFINQDLFFAAEKTNTGLQLWHFNNDEVTGVQDAEDNAQIRLFPNPAADFIYFESPRPDFRSWRLVNLKGQNVSIQKGSSGKIYVGHLSPGLYFFVAEGDKKTVIRKFVKQ